MKPVKLKTLLEGIADTRIPDAVISDVVTDSRQAGEGKLYVAIIGDRYNGNDFTREALEMGAVAAVVSRITPNCAGEQILVEDTKSALVSLAANYRNDYEFRSIAVTGSVGKTTVKEMTYAILSRFGATLKTYGNRNNVIGFPGTLLSLTGEEKYAVLEMGMSMHGEITLLSKALRPDVAVITCIGVSHIEYLGTKENILSAKLEITDGMSADGTVVYNADDPLLAERIPTIARKTVSFGIENERADVVAKGISTMGASTYFTIEDKENGSFEASLPALGRHNVLNALAAYTACICLGLEPSECAAGLSDYVPFGMRQNIVVFNDITVIEDCYNASPESMRASLQALTDIVRTGVKIAVLGDMLELGELSDEAHKEVGREAAKLGVDIVLCCGERAKLIVDTAAACGVIGAKHFPDRIELADYLVRTVRAGDGVLVKASRAMEFEKILEQFYKDEKWTVQQ